MPKLVLSDTAGEREVALSKDVISIGRIPQGNDVVINVAEASRQHCKVLREGNAWFVEDLGGRNGTRVNGRKVTKFELQDGDEIQVGLVTLRFLESDVAAGPAADAGPEPELEISLDEEAYLRFLNTDRENEKIALTGRVTIGSKSNNSVALSERGISGSHCELVEKGGEWIVRDLGSTNGTFVDGEKSMESKLAPGTIVRIGVCEFVFGIGQNEGSASLVSTVQMAAPPVNDEIFTVSDRNLGRREKAQFVLWLGFFAIVLGSAGAWFTLGVARKQEVVEVTNVPGNLVTAGASFEVTEELGDYLVTESDSVDYEEVAVQRHSGRASLKISATSGSGTHLVSFAQPIDNLSTNDQLEIAGWFRTSALTQGLAGLAMVWRDSDDRPLGTTFISAPSGRSAFTEVKGVVKPPYGVARASFAMAVHDAGGTVHVDDVRVLRLVADSRKGHVFHGYEALVSENGTLTVSRDADEIIEHAGFFWTDGKMARSTQSMFVASSVEHSPSGSRLDGEIAPSAAGASGAVTIDVQKSENGLGFAGTIASTDTGIALGLTVDPAEGIVTISGGKATRRREPFVANDVTAVVVSSRYRAVRITQETPTTVSLVPTKEGMALLYPLASADGGLAFKQNWQFDFEKEGKETVDVSQAASRAELVDKAYGRAMVMYQDIIDRFPFNQDVTERAAARLDVLSRQASTQLARLEQRRKDTEFFGTFDADFDGIVAEADAAAAGYEGTSFAEQFKDITKGLSDARDNVVGSRRLERARNHLMRGRDLLTGGRTWPSLALGFFRSAMELAPSSDVAKEAGEELMKLESRLGVK